MDKSREKKVFEKARKLADSGDYAGSYEILDKILPGGIKNEDLENLIMSYYGMCRAFYLRETRDGLEICKEAVKKEMFRSDVYLNLGKIYLHRGTKGKAYDAFMKGLKLDKNNKKIEKELKKMGIRKKPVLPFLDRSNFFNKWLGIIRASFIKD